MIALLPSFIRDVAYLGSKGLFSATDRKSRLNLVAKQFGPNYFASVKRYASIVSGEEFINDCKKLQSEIRSRKKNSKLIAAYCDFLSLDFSEILDNLPSNFDLLDKRRTKKDLFKHLPDSFLTDAIIARLSAHNTRQVAREAATFLAACGISTSEVQSAHTIKPRAKNNIRTLLSKKLDSYAVFTANRGLLGGLRAFVSGSVHDNTWDNLINILLSKGLVK